MGGVTGLDERMRDGGSLALLDEQGTRSVIHYEDQRVHGAVFADLDSDAPGLEAATAG